MEIKEATAEIATVIAEMAIPMAAINSSVVIIIKEVATALTSIKPDLIVTALKAKAMVNLNKVTDPRLPVLKGVAISLALFLWAIWATLTIAVHSSFSIQWE